MAKTKPVEKRTVTCGKCKVSGHNARTCAEKISLVTETAEVTKLEEAVEISPPPVSKTKIGIRDDERRHSRIPRREAPTADIGAAASAAPFRCQKCNQVAILVIVRVKDHVASQKKGEEVFKGDLRCEKCMNKPIPSNLILKWGALPNETVSGHG